METFLAAAFAIGRLLRVYGFHPSPEDTAAPELSLLTIKRFWNQQQEPKSYSVIPREIIQAFACFEHSDLIKVTRWQLKMRTPTENQQRRLKAKANDE